MKILRRHVAAILLAAASLATAAAPPARLWEDVSAGSRDVAASVAASQGADDSQQVELTVKDGNVYLSLTRTTVVEVFTILGQPVSRETLKAGIHRLRLKSRGIYILRAGQVTRRITV